MLANLAADTKAVFAGQHQIENYQVRLLGNDPRRRLGSVTFDLDVKTVGLQVLSGQIGQTLVILDDQHLTALLLHGSPRRLVVIKECPGNGFTKRQHRPRILRRAPTPANRHHERQKTTGWIARKAIGFVVGCAPENIRRDNRSQ
ncbi:hypothetical protein D9M71_519650 [compost metagenome]